MNKIKLITFAFFTLILSACQHCEITKKQFSYISIVVPENYQLYRKKITEYVQLGGENPLEKIRFIKKRVEIPCTDNIIKKSAEIAANEIYPEKKIKLVYFKIQNKTAYIVSSFDIDGWAGVSVVLGIIRPVIEKTLLQFPQVDKVIFDYAPEDKNR